jgi:hypothetical protein
MAMTQPIQSGGIYWVYVEGARLRLRAIEIALQGWWRCVDQAGAEIMVPELAFLDECCDAVGFAR